MTTRFSFLSHRNLIYVKHWIALSSTFLSLVLTLPFSVSGANTELHKTSILINPLGTAISVLATGFSYTSLSLNGRYQTMLTDQWALTLSPQLVYTDLASLETYVLGVKAGSRYCLSGRALDGWYATPMLLAGSAFTYQRDDFKQFAYLLGLGLESGYTWRWDHLLFELGLGLHYSGLIGHRATFDNESGKVPSFGLGPILNVGIGYSW